MLRQDEAKAWSIDDIRYALPGVTHEELTTLVADTFTTIDLATDVASWYGMLHPEMVKEIKLIAHGALHKELPNIRGEPLKQYWAAFKNLFPVNSEGLRVNYSGDLISNAQTEASFADIGPKSHSNCTGETKKNIFRHVLSVKRPITRKLLKSKIIKRKKKCKTLKALRPLRDKASRLAYIEELELISSSLDDIHRNLGRPVRKRIAGKGKRALEYATSTNRVREEISVNKRKAEKSSYILSAESISSL